MANTQLPDEEPLRKIAARRTARWFRREAETPIFGRLLLFQGCSAAGDTLLALALAGSLFFSVPETTARSRVVLYLLLTLAPLAFVAPILARALDRHRAGLRIALIASAAGRAILAWLLAPNLDSLLLFPISFGVLALSRAGLVAKGAILPTVVPERRTLVAANSSLAKMSAVAGIVVLPLGMVLVHTLGAAADLRLAATLYLFGALPAWGLPPVHPPPDSSRSKDRRRGKPSLTVRRAVVATAGMRFLVGFLAFHLAFGLRREGLNAVGVGLLIGAAALGSLLGGVLAGRFRQGLSEEGIVVSALAVMGVAGIGVGPWFSIPLATGLVFGFGVASGASKVAFDSIVQRETTEGLRGWVFARYESGLQLSWVCGALIPVAVTIPISAGIIAAGMSAVVLAVIHAVSRLRRSVSEPRRRG